MRCLSGIVMLAILTSNLYPQQSGDTSAEQICYSELYRKEGWTIPGLQGARKKGGRGAVPEKPDVYLTALEPPHRGSTIQIFRCSREHTGRLEIEDLDVGIIDLSSFDVGGRIFAYNLIYGVDGIAAEWSIRFYDLDGSGRFTLRRTERSRFTPELIPDWVKNRDRTQH